MSFSKLSRTIIISLLYLAVHFSGYTFAEDSRGSGETVVTETGRQDLEVKVTYDIDSETIEAIKAIEADHTDSKTETSRSRNPDTRRMTPGESSGDLSAFKKFAVDVDQISGSAGLRYPIVVPQGRGGMEPNLSLNYSPHHKQGSFGAGWSLESGAIERSTEDGVPKYTSEDTFLLRQGGSVQELVYDEEAGFYRPKNEGAFLKIEQVSDYWVVTDKSGIKYYFGDSDDSREYNPASPGNVFKWYLKHTEDIHGNEMTYAYFRDEHIVFPEEIAYTGNSGRGVLPHARVVFEYESRGGAYDWKTDYRAGFKRNMLMRMKGIAVYAGGALERYYEMEYFLGWRSGRSLLGRIISYGADGVTADPATVFVYDHAGPRYWWGTGFVTGSFSGDNLWNYRYSGGYDRGHDNYGPVPGFDLELGPTYTANSGSWDGGSWTINDYGRLDFSVKKDSANQFWTYLFVNEAKTIHVPYVRGEGIIGTWVNNDFSESAERDWTLKEGYNVVSLTAYHQHEDFSFTLGTNLADLVDVMGSEQKILPQLAGDFNGDGYMDTGAFVENVNHVVIKRSTGEAFGGDEIWLSGLSEDKRVFTGDFNGDGRTDICAFDEDSGNWEVFTSDGTQFVNQGVWAGGFGAGRERAGVGDFNGDGRTDIYYLAEGNANAVFAYSSGTGFPETSPAATVTDDPYTAIPTDVNSDGLTDFVSFNKDTGEWIIRLNPGKEGTAFISQGSTSGFGTDRNPFLGDINDDGFVDIGYYEYTTGSLFFMLYDGTGFPYSEELVFRVPVHSESAAVQTSDFNGDGIIDFIVHAAAGYSVVLHSDGGGTPTDLLQQTDNGLKGITEIEYVPSVNFPQTYLPFSMPVVQSITRADGFGERYTTTYEYADGLWDSEEREFRGFGMVKVIDPQGNYVETEFLQDDILKGKPQRQESFDSEGRLYAKTEYTYDSEEIAPETNFVYLKRKDNYVYDGDSDGRRTAGEYFYEEEIQLGNLTKAVQYGEVDFLTGEDIGEDHKTILTAYHNNTDAGSWLIGLPKQVVVLNESDRPATQTFFFYDDLGPEEPVEKGLLTAKVDWLKGRWYAPANPKTQYAYDEFGNLTSTTDPLGNVTTITYDAEYHVFPLETENALGHAVANEYYGVDGVPRDSGGGFRGLWGQLKSTTDPNEQTGLRGYDVFGRVVKTVAPLDSNERPTTEFQYIFNSDHICVIQKQRLKHGQADTLKTVQYYDGLGRLIQVKTPAEAAGYSVVGGQSEYDSRGLVVRQYLPRLTTRDLMSMDDVDPGASHVITDYDAMGRVVQVTNPDGTYRTVEYDDWDITAIDENGHKQKSYFDAYGRLVKKEEYTGTDGRSPHYPAESFALYAVTQYEYDSEGSLTKTIDDAGNVTTVNYDKLGRKTAMRDPDMGFWQYTYDKNGNLKTQTDARDNLMQFNYDELNRLFRKFDSLGMNVSYTYDDELVNFSKGRLTKAKYGRRDYTDFEYDALGRETEAMKVINDVEYAVTRDYDALSRLSMVEYPDDQILQYAYNAAGHIEQVIDGESGFEESVLLDTGDATAAEGFLLDILQWLGAKISLVDETTINSVAAKFSSHTELTSAGDVTVVLYSGVGVPASEVYSKTFFVEAVEGDDFVRREFDGLNWDVPAGDYWIAFEVRDGSTYRGSVQGHQSVPNPAADEAYAWEGVWYGWDALDLVLEVKGTARAFEETIVHTGEIRENYGWYLNSNQWLASKISLSEETTLYSVESVFGGIDKDVDGGTLTVALYTDGGETPGSEIYTEEFYVEGNVARYFTRRRVDGLNWTAGPGNYWLVFEVRPGQTYDGGMQGFAVPRPIESEAYAWLGEWVEKDDLDLGFILKGIKSSPDTAPQIVTNVDYNASGQITNIEYGNGTQTNYTYDPKTLRLDQMITRDSSDAEIQNLSYEYDSAGQIVEIVDSLHTDSQSFVYDELNRLVEAVGDSYGTKTYRYDTIGNIIEKDGLVYTYGERCLRCPEETRKAGPHAVTSLSDGSRFTYDRNGNMAAMERGDVYTEYLYDSENRLLFVKENGVVKAEFAYDGDGGRTRKITYGDTTQVSEFVGSLYETTNGRKTNHIFLGSQRVASVTGGEIVYYHANHLGSTNLLTNEAGELAELIEYTPYGEFARHEKYGDGDDVAWHYFTGQRLDKETGLYYYGARYYNPVLGRFITPDIYVQAPDDPQSFNRYTYTRDNPVNLIDPTGHFFWLVVPAFVAVAAIVVGVTTEAGANFFEKWGDFVSPLARAVVTNDWANFGMQALNFAGMITAPNPMLQMSAKLSYLSRAVSHIGDNASKEISRVLNYAAITFTAIDLAGNITESVKRLQAVSKLDSHLETQIVEASKLERTVENIQNFEDLTAAKALTEIGKKALAIKPIASLVGIAGGVAIRGSLSDWDPRETVMGGLIGGSFGYFSSGTRAGFPENALWGEFEPWFQGIKSFHARVAVKTQIYGINIKANMYSWDWVKGQEMVPSISDIDPGEQIQWTDSF